MLSFGQRRRSASTVPFSRAAKEWKPPQSKWTDGLCSELGYPFATRALASSTAASRSL